MPELPDVEVLRETLRTFVGDTITQVEVTFPLTFRVYVEGTPHLLCGHMVKDVGRRGKFLVLTLDGLYLVFNMMLTGRLYTGEASRRNTIVVLTFVSGRVLKFADFKKMGKIYITDALEKIPQYQELGIEPLSEAFTKEMLSKILRDPREIKIVLTDQRVIAGIGNAYSDEILFHARIDPRRTADSMKSDEAATLYESIQFVLKNALDRIREGGNAFDENRDFLSVHGRKGQPCPVCGSTIREIEVFKRETSVCPQCQHVQFPL